MKSCHQQHRIPDDFHGRQSFTLLELLVVIVIIALLSSLLLTGVARARRQGALQRARNDIQGLVTAFRLMESDYGRYPYWDEQLRPINRDLSQILGGLWNLGTWENLNWQTRPYNVNQRVYIQITTGMTNANGELLDPWGQPYWCVFDGNNDGIVTNPFTSNAILNVPLLIWSKGPDKTNDLGGESSARNRDNLTSY